MPGSIWVTTSQSEFRLVLVGQQVNLPTLDKQVEVSNGEREYVNNPFYSLCSHTENSLLGFQVQICKTLLHNDIDKREHNTYVHLPYITEWLCISPT